MLNRGIPYCSGPGVAGARGAAITPRHRDVGNPRQDHDHEPRGLDPRRRAGRGSGIPDRRGVAGSRRVRAARDRATRSSSRPTSTTRPSSTRAPSSCTTARERWSSTISSSTTPTSIPTSPPSSASSTSWCARCRATGSIICRADDAEHRRRARPRLLDTGADVRQPARTWRRTGPATRRATAASALLAAASAGGQHAMAAWPATTTPRT